MLPSTQTTDVIIAGCGPTGAMLSVLLSQLGVSSICLDREPGVVTDPRGIALDEDGIRALQSVGVLDQVYARIGRCMGVFKFIGGIHSDLHSASFMRMDYSTSEGGTGHVGFICHKQPALEEALRQRIRTESISELRTECTVTAISEHEDTVSVTYQDRTGFDRNLTAKFLVGADGKTGFTRKCYLEPKGVLMEKISETGDYSETWVAMNLKLTMPTPETHPQFPLWSQGYSPEEVYDAFFPADFRFLCNPLRPAVCGRFGLPKDRLWRFEYVVREGEDGETMASAENVRKIVFPYFRHAGRKYGLATDVAFPEECIETIRCRPFYFSARSCNRWAQGRVVLCGDAAHVFPPFGGQGLASGFRDAMALAWRLQVACHHLPSSHEQLLQGWYIERKQQLERSLAATIENGLYVTEANPVRIWLRNTCLALMQLIPSWNRWLEQGARREGLCHYTYRPGLHFSSDFHGGGLLPQVYCCVGALDPQVRFSDDIIFSPEKRGLFQLVVIVSSYAALQGIGQELRSLDIDTMSNGFVWSSEATTIVENTMAHFAETVDLVVRVASTEEFEQSPLCQDRPKPKYYDERRMSKEFASRPYIIVRPDRFVFAACSTSHDLGAALRQIEPTLRGETTACVSRRG